MAIWWRVVLGAAAGLVVGSIIGYLGRSRGGTCAITCNPYTAAIFGAVVGGLLAYTSRPAGVAAMATVPAITSDQEFERVVLGSSRPVMVDFYTPDCGFCVKLAPIMSELAGEYAGRADVVKVDARQVPALANRYDVRGVPTVVVLAGGRELRRWAGLESAAAYRAGLDDAIRRQALFGQGATAAAEAVATAEAAGKPDAARDSQKSEKGEHGAESEKSEKCEKGQKSEQDERGDHVKERKGIVTFKGKPLTLLGSEVKVGHKAPDFVAVANDLSETRLSNWQGKVRIIATVPSLDTPVCDLETRKFNEQAGELGGGVVVLTISMDLPFAQKRWCGAAGVKNVQTVSDYREGAAGMALGVMVKELRLLARAVFVVDRQDIVRHVQIVPEMTQEPDYEAAMAAVRELTKT